ncbi:hypothetical protein L6164_033424 [Bauhinia variegata]|uniref:Uncharacterized protein n=1 Tax=Bauhinia variegata TaxID=167791 RepID=A0ACB9KRL5_BAUVA|nr:hypothetical protein L6164_033424 [Bauhinia variegata]
MEKYFKRKSPTEESSSQVETIDESRNRTQGLAFSGNDESMSSSNQGNFLANHNEAIHKVLKNARGNLKLTAPAIQKDIVRAAAARRNLSGRGLNQETTIKKAGDTRWGSHYSTLPNLAFLFSSMIDVIELVEEDGIISEQRAEACALLNSMQSFEFVFILLLMKNILGITHELSQALQRSDQDIVNAMKLVTVSKQKLQDIRDDGWHSLLNEVSLFCEKHNIDIPNMNDIFRTQGRSRRKMEKVSNLLLFQVELFYQVIDLQLQELNNHFTEVNI